MGPSKLEELLLSPDAPNGERLPPPESGGRSRQRDKRQQRVEEGEMDSRTAQTSSQSTSSSFSFVLALPPPADVSPLSCKESVIAAMMQREASERRSRTNRRTITRRSAASVDDAGDAMGNAVDDAGEDINECRDEGRDGGYESQETVDMFVDGFPSLPPLQDPPRTDSRTDNRKNNNRRRGRSREDLHRSGNHRHRRDATRRTERQPPGRRSSNLSSSSVPDDSRKRPSSSDDRNRHRRRRDENDSPRPRSHDDRNRNPHRQRRLRPASRSRSNERQPRRRCHSNDRVLASSSPRSNRHADRHKQHHRSRSQDDTVQRQSRRHRSNSTSDAAVSVDNAVSNSRDRIQSQSPRRRRSSSPSSRRKERSSSRYSSSNSQRRRDSSKRTHKRTSLSSSSVDEQLHSSRGSLDAHSSFPQIAPNPGLPPRPSKTSSKWNALRTSVQVAKETNKKQRNSKKSTLPITVPATATATSSPSARRSSSRERSKWDNLRNANTFINQTKRKKRSSKHRQKSRSNSNHSHKSSSSNNNNNSDVSPDDDGCVEIVPKITPIVLRTNNTPAPFVMPNEDKVLEVFRRATPAPVGTSSADADGSERVRSSCNSLTRKPRSNQSLFATDDSQPDRQNHGSSWNEPVVHEPTTTTSKNDPFETVPHHDLILQVSATELINRSSRSRNRRSSHGRTSSRDKTPTINGKSNTEGNDDDDDVDSFFDEDNDDKEEDGTSPPPAPSSPHSISWDSVRKATTLIRAKKQRAAESRSRQHLMDDSTFHNLSSHHEAGNAASKPRNSNGGNSINSANAIINLRSAYTQAAQKSSWDLIGKGNSVHTNANDGSKHETSQNRPVPRGEQHRSKQSKWAGIRKSMEFIQKTKKKGKKGKNSKPKDRTGMSDSARDGHENIARTRQPEAPVSNIIATPSIDNASWDTLIAKAKAMNEDARQGEGDDDYRDTKVGDEKGTKMSRKDSQISSKSTPTASKSPSKWSGLRHGLRFLQKAKKGRSRSLDPMPATTIRADFAPTIGDRSPKSRMENVVNLDDGATGRRRHCRNGGAGIDASLHSIIT